MVVWVFRVTTALLVFWFVFLCGFAVWFGFGGDFVVGGSLVYMGLCCGSVVLEVDACWVTSVFTGCGVWVRVGGVYWYVVAISVGLGGAVAISWWFFGRVFTRLTFLRNSLYFQAR